MRFRSPLLTTDFHHPINQEVFDLLTDAQLAKLAVWSVRTGKDVTLLIRQAGFMVEQISEDSNECRMLGLLPHCGLFGSLEPDGSTHT
jgi:hypothetical protein